MNISRIFNSMYSNTVNNNKQAQNSDEVSSTTKKNVAQKPDAISSATKRSGGDHYFEAKA